MKSFEKFIKEEVDLTGNKGISPDFMSKSEEEARRSLGIRPDDERQMAQIWPEFERNMRQSDQLLRTGKDGRPLNQEQLQERVRSLEELAELVVREEFGEILNTSIKPIELQIKLVTQGGVSREISDIRNVPQQAEQPKEEEQPEQPQEQPEQPQEQPEQPQEQPEGEQPEGEQEVGTDLVSAISKKKLLNMITQAAGKATKDIIRASDTVERELSEIFGERQGKQVLGHWVAMSDLADKMDWAIPLNRKSQMMKDMPQGMAGACQVIWESYSGNHYNMNLLLEKEATKIVIKSAGVDFPMLIHETVKGIYLFLQSGAIKKDKETAKIIKKATSSFADEAQDFRYGPPALEMLVKFVNKFPESGQYKRLDTRVFIMMACDKERALEEAKNNTKEEWKQYLDKKASIARTDDQFNEIMKSIFSCFDLEGSEFVLNEERFDNSHAKSEIQKIIKYIVDDIEDYKRELEEWERYEKERQEEEKWKSQSKDLESDEEESDIDKIIRQSNEKEDEVEEDDYSKMSDDELMSLSFDAAADGNFELAKKIRSYVKTEESLIIIDHELKRINESYKFHGRRN
jgi:hypothetical protein